MHIRWCIYSPLLQVSEFIQAFRDESVGHPSKRLYYDKGIYKGGKEGLDVSASWPERRGFYTFQLPSASYLLRSMHHPQLASVIPSHRCFFGSGEGIPSERTF